MADAAQIGFSGAGFPDQLDVSSDWQFISVAVQKRPTKSDSECWLKKDEFSGWQRIENSKGFWKLFGPLLSTQRPQFKQNRSFKWTVAKACCGVAVLGLAFLGGNYRDLIFKSARDHFATPANAEFSKDIEDGLAKAIVGIRAELPKRIDATTTLMWVSYSGTKMIYDNRLEADGSKLDDATKKKLAQLIIVNSCSSSASRKLLDLGGSFRYVYSDIQAKLVMAVDITKDQCS
jgi:hypothetical protein